jgi:DNA-binding beta-propeller fold protein YncE
MNARWRRFATVLIAAAAAFACTVAPALAAETIVGPETGERAGQLNDPLGVAVDQSSGTVFVADRNNWRIDEFDTAGHFLLAFGVGVRTGARELQSCTAVCVRGLTGGVSDGFTPASVAVDQASHDVYVSDVGGYRVEKYTAKGEFLLMFGGEVNRTEVEKREEEEAKSEPVTVTREEEDICTETQLVAGESCGPGLKSESPGSFVSYGEGLGESPQLFPMAVDGEGHVWVGDVGRLEEFSSEGVFMSELKLPGAGAVESLAVDAFGDLNVVSSEVAGVRKLEPDGAVVFTVDAAGHPNAVALDPVSGALFVSDQEEPSQTVNYGKATLLEFDSSGVQTEAFGAGEVLGGPKGNALAFDGATGRLYVASHASSPSPSAVQAFALPAPGPLVQSGSTVAGPVAKTGATLNATVDPEDAATTYHFQYVDQRSFESEGGFASPHTVTTTESASIGEDFAGHQASFEIEAGRLTPGTAYRFRVVATNTNAHGGVDGEAGSFETLPPARVDSTTVSRVTSSSATLESEIDPLGAATTYRFEYLTEAEFQADGEGFSGPDLPVVAPQPEAPLGSGEGDVPVSVHLQGLAAVTEYRYRVVARNALGAEPGPVGSFTTQAARGSVALLDGREWELVSPADKHGASIESIRTEGGSTQAAVGGGAMTFMAYSPTEGQPAGYANMVQVLAVRGSDGWTSRDIGIPHERATTTAIGQGQEDRIFSEDLSTAVVQPFGTFIPSSSPLALAPREASEQTAFLRTDYGSGGGVCAESCYRPLVSGASGYANVPAGTVFGEEGKCPPQERCGPQFLDASPDLSHVVLTSSAPLTPGANSDALYEWTAGKLALVSVLPKTGEPAPEAQLASAHEHRHSVSTDGRVFWNTVNGHLYVWDPATGASTQLDAVQGGSGGGQVSPGFKGASADGSRVFFTDQQSLTPGAGGGSGDGEGDLYECELVEAGGELSCRLSDLTPPNTRNEEGRVQGVVDVSGDGSWVYFVADGVLAQGAVPGGCPGSSPADVTCNLYVWHDGTTRLVAVLSGEDSNDWGALVNLTARVSPDGRWLAFMSERELTGYDNRDAVSGMRDTEVYLYHANPGPSGGLEPGRLVCASCDPSGARPVGAENGESQRIGVITGLWNKDKWLAAYVPGWTPFELQDALYQSRYLSDSGRLFFNSGDALVPQDVNGAWDVYEYEPPGVGSCTEASATFSQRSGGCVDLISSGQSAQESGFLDASETGGDVFFMTTARLVAQDYDTAVDIYDAHECTSAEPCFPAVAAVPPACGTGDACKPAPTPQPAIFGAPASATFTGAGNVSASPANVKPKSSKVKPKSSTGARKLKQALRVCHGERGRRRRSCERRAKARYAARRRSQTTKRDRG